MLHIRYNRGGPDVEIRYGKWFRLVNENAKLELTIPSVKATRNASVSLNGREIGTVAKGRSAILIDCTGDLTYRLRSVTYTTRPEHDSSYLQPGESEVLAKAYLHNLGRSVDCFLHSAPEKISVDKSELGLVGETVKSELVEIQ